ncbi:MAG: molybdopterin-dependent oxidoreductase, partial [Cyanobacteria bacterium P01_H01_bin.130]
MSDPQLLLAASPAKTACPYCGVGCGLEVLPPPGPEKPPKVRGDRAHPSSQGMVCVKGATVLESLDKDRLLYPMMRDSLADEFRRVTWDEALDAIAGRIRSTVETLGSGGVCMYGSGQFLTEDYYVAQKLMKGFLGTNNFDANSRLCMSSAVAAYK